MQCSTQIQWILNPGQGRRITDHTASTFLHPDHIDTAKRLIAGVPAYEPTPLVYLDALSTQWSLGGIYVKDESHRFQLNAFKALGGLYAIATVICRRLGLEVGDVTFEQLVSEEIRTKVGPLLFVSATDGNHGRGIAWAARRLGQNAMIFMPKGSSPHRLERIRAEGAGAEIIDLNYDDAVRYAHQYAQEKGGILVQDTAWEGYEEIPTLIMQGYAVIMEEVLDSLKKQGRPLPTHVFLQAGVGSFAGAMQGYLTERFGAQCPITVILEPKAVACHYRSALENDGNIHPITGNFHTIMAGLSCGEPSLVSWRILHRDANVFATCADSIAATGMRILAAPLPGDRAVISGESGAVGMGLLSRLSTPVTQEEAALKQALRLDHTSHILLISTEGDTDPVHYRRIVWEGAYPSSGVSL